MVRNGARPGTRAHFVQSRLPRVRERSGGVWSVHTVMLVITLLLILLPFILTVILALSGRL